MNYVSDVGIVYGTLGWEVNGHTSRSLGDLITGTPAQHNYHTIGDQTVYYDDNLRYWCIVGSSFYNTSYPNIVKAAESIPRTYTGRIADWPRGEYRSTNASYTGRIFHAEDGKGVWVYDNGAVNLIKLKRTTGTWIKVEN